MATILIHDPTAPSGAVLEDEHATLGGPLAGGKVGLIDNGWASYEIAVPHLKERLRERFGVVDFHEFKKSMVKPVSEEAVNVFLEDSAAVIMWMGN